ncbi:MAG: glycoside hydrolase family 78 protein [Bacteroidales bacterium]|nr:glycoside hydrolase family 78 protein [Bacteroidales bacterium]MBN2761720.1 glycoside hydrolase family 78 protein [Bacteroidales bacterium]
MQGKKKIILVFLLPLTLLSIHGCNSLVEKEDLSVTNLRCEMLVNPEGIDITIPRLSWIIESPQRNIQQTDYQILVASTPERLDKNEGDIWNSGKIASGRSVHIPYAGLKLKSRMRCYWKVKVWSRHGESEWSKPAYWSMGLLHYKDWQGRWIGFDRAFPWDRIDRFSRLSARYFRKEFETPPEKEIKHATAYMMGLGLYELYINGQKAGTDVLAPSPTDYTKSVLYNTYDITQSIKPGKNAVGVILGNGRYFTMRQNYKPYKIKTFGFPKMLMNLVVEYTDGTVKVIRTDDTWKGSADGPVRSNNEYDGEEYDARKEMPGWNAVGFDDASWLKAEYVREPGGQYKAQMNENMCIMDTVHPVSVTHLDADRYILDMGQNMVGWLKIKVKGQRGQQVRLRFAEILKKDGELDTDNLRDALNTDIYTLKGGEEEFWHPSFVYHGFRYVGISGYPGIPELRNFSGEVVFDALNTTGTFTCSNDILNRIWNNARESIRGNYKGMPIDCPQRSERQPWLGDRAVHSTGESYLFDNAKLYAKWLDDIQQSQKADGCLPDMAPPYYNYYSDNMTWPGAYIMVAYMLYRQYGNKHAINEHYTDMKDWLDYMRDRYLENYIMTKDSYGDWCAPPMNVKEGEGVNADIKRPSRLISTAYYFYYLQLMQEFSQITGHKTDASDYINLADSIKNAFNREFLKSDTTYIETNRLTDNLLPLYFGLVPSDFHDKVLKKTISFIMNENKGHLSTGMIGTQWLMRSLTENGRADIAYCLATNTTYPSWGYMIENGATTIWELWNGNTAAPGMNSHNHVMLLGDLLIWYYENLAGIKPDLKDPGFKRIIIQPEFVDDLKFVKAAYNSIYGTIVSYWKRDEKGIKWRITIPANTTADIIIPGTIAGEFTEGGKSLKKAYGIHRIRKDNKNIYLETGSGTYDFVINH